MAQAGNGEAFGELVTRHLRRAYAVAYRIVGNRHDAEDLVQEAFVAAFRKFDTFDTQRPFGPWFFRILVNRGFNARKSSRVRATQDLTDDLGARGISPDKAAEHAQLQDALQAALLDLPPRQRVLVELVELEGFTPSEAAELLEISPATARWHLHTARGNLRVVLTSYR